MQKHEMMDKIIQYQMRQISTAQVAKALDEYTEALQKPMATAGVVLFDGNNKVIIQSANYIEDGWFIAINGSEIVLWEIPYGGGQPIKIDNFLTVAESIRAAGLLT